MSCNFPNCNIKGESDRYVSCWLCDGLAHIKCAGLTGRILDSIIDCKGLRWSCLNCRSIEIDLFKVYRETRNGFNEIGRDLVTLTEKFRHYEKLFKSFKCLNDSHESSKPAPKRKRPSDEVTLSSSVQKRTSPPNDLINLSSPCPQGDKPSTSKELNSPKALSNSNKCLTIPEAPPINLVASVNNLIVIPPKKSIFISRLAKDTLVEDIKSYISSRLKIDDINIRKFNFNYDRSISSFKIDVSLETFKKILDSSFWPPGAFVREFKPKLRSQTEENIVKLPKATTDIKN